MNSNCFSFAVVVALAGFATGCTSSSNYSKAGEVSSSLHQGALSIDEDQAQVDAALIALADLVNNPGADLKPQFQQFELSVDKLVVLSTEVNRVSAAMQAQGASYLAQWDTDSATIQDEGIRAKSIARKNVVAANLERVRVSHAQTQAAFEPFISRLTDVRTALATDLTTGGIASVKRAANDAEAEAAPVREALRELSIDFSGLSASLASDR